MHPADHSKSLLPEYQLKKKNFGSAAKENLTTVQEILVRFLQTKGGLDVRCLFQHSDQTCQGKVVKENLFS
jgi:hypothetical protein